MDDAPGDTAPTDTASTDTALNDTARSNMDRSGTGRPGNADTRRTYRAGWEQWLTFTDERDIAPVPVSASVVTDFIEWLRTQERPGGSAGYALNTIETYLTAVAVAHRDAGVFLPYLQTVTVEDEDGNERRRYSDAEIERYRAAVEQARTEPGPINPIRSEAVRKRREALHEAAEYETSTRAPVLLKHLNRMSFDEDQIADLRDRALLHIGFGGAFRRSELVGVQYRHIRSIEGGIAIYIPDSDADQGSPNEEAPDGANAAEAGPNEESLDEESSARPGPGRLPRFPNEAPGFHVDPVDALQAWVDAAGITSGPVFRGVDRWGNVRKKALSGNSLYRIVQKWMGRLGYDPEAYGARSLRTGFMKQCEIDNIPQLDMLQQAGYKSARISYGYGAPLVRRPGYMLARLGGTGDDSDST